MGARRQEALDYHAQGRPGKIQVLPTKPVKNQRDLSLAGRVREVMRGSDVNDIVNMAVIAAVDAQERAR